MVADAQAAFVGQLSDISTERRVSGAMGEMVGYVFEVETVVSGSLPERVTVFSPAEESACGLGLQVGDIAGLALRREGDAWVAGLCNITAPSELAAVADSPPRVVTATPTRTSREVESGRFDPEWLLVGALGATGALTVLVLRRRR